MKIDVSPAPNRRKRTSVDTVSIEAQRKRASNKYDAAPLFTAGAEAYR